MTTKQTGEASRKATAWAGRTGGGTFGHGGAYATNMTIDPKRGLITVFMVQHAGFPGDGGQEPGGFPEGRGAGLPGLQKVSCVERADIWSGASYRRILHRRCVSRAITASGLLLRVSRWNGLATLKILYLNPTGIPRQRGDVPA